MLNSTYGLLQFSKLGRKTANILNVTSATFSLNGNKTKTRSQTSSRAILPGPPFPAFCNTVKPHVGEPTSTFQYIFYDLQGDYL